MHIRNQTNRVNTILLFSDYTRQLKRRIVFEFLNTIIIQFSTYAIGFMLRVIFNSRKTNHDVIKVFFDLMV